MKNRSISIPIIPSLFRRKSDRPHAGLGGGKDNERFIAVRVSAGATRQAPQNVGLRFADPTYRPRLHSQCGMTLLELAVVLLILVTLATVALRSTSGLQDQARWEQTKNRYEEIKKAVIGDPDLAINGHPDISGFVTDMGRLPNNIHELLEEDFCLTNKEIPDEPTCTTSNWTNQTSITYTSTIGSIGWNGPYLLTSENYSEPDAYADGWGNLAANVSDQNYGWVINVYPTTLALQSKGCAGCSLAEYNHFYPSTTTAIGLTNWLIPVNTGLGVNIQTPANGSCSTVTLTNGNDCNNFGGTWDSVTSTCTPATATPTTKSSCENVSGTWTATTKDICLRIYFREISSGNTIIDDPATSHSVPILEDGREHFVTFSGFSNTTSGARNYIPMGINAVAVYEHSGGVCTTNTYPHTGMTSIKVAFYPKRAIPTINW